MGEKRTGGYMQRIGLDKNWDFYESDESMSFVFATPPSQKVDLPHDFIVGACSEILYISIYLYASLFFKLLIIYIFI